MQGVHTTPRVCRVYIPHPGYITGCISFTQGYTRGVLASPRGIQGVHTAPGVYRGVHTAPWVYLRRKVHLPGYTLEERGPPTRVYLRERGNPVAKSASLSPKEGKDRVIPWEEFSPLGGLFPFHCWVLFSPPLCTGFKGGF